MHSTFGISSVISLERENNFTENFKLHEELFCPKFMINSEFQRNFLLRLIALDESSLDRMQRISFRTSADGLIKYDTSDRLVDEKQMNNHLFFQSKSMQVYRIFYACVHPMQDNERLSK